MKVVRLPQHCYKSWRTAFIPDIPACQIVTSKAENSGWPFYSDIADAYSFIFQEKLSSSNSQVVEICQTPQAWHWTAMINAWNAQLLNQATYASASWKFPQLSARFLFLMPLTHAQPSISDTDMPSKNGEYCSIIYESCIKYIHNHQKIRSRILYWHWFICKISTQIIPLTECINCMFCHLMGFCIYCKWQEHPGLHLLQPIRPMTKVRLVYGIKADDVSNSWTLRKP